MFTSFDGCKNNFKDEKVLLLPLSPHDFVVMCHSHAVCVGLLVPTTTTGIVPCVLLAFGIVLEKKLRKSIKYPISNKYAVTPVCRENFPIGRRPIEYPLLCTRVLSNIF